MKILKILGIAAGIHAIALILIFANPGCSYSNAASAETSPIASAPVDTSSPASSAISSAPDSVAIRYSPTRPGTVVASALEAPPVADVTPATTYTVAKGDSLSTIAKKHQLSKADLAAANSLKTSAVLHVGQKLIIPAKAPAPAAASAAPSAARAAEAGPSDKPAGDSVRHTVRPGETLGAIARKYGIRQGDLAVANNITDPRKIQPGQELVIPARSSASKQGKGAKSGTAEASKAVSPGAPPAAGPDQDLDAGLKPANPTEVPVIKIEDSSSASQPKTP